MGNTKVRQVAESWPKFRRNPGLQKSARAKGMEFYESDLGSESHLFSVFLRRRRRRRWLCSPAIDGARRGWIRVQDGEDGSQELTDPLLGFGPGITS